MNKSDRTIKKNGFRAENAHVRAAGNDVVVGGGLQTTAKDDMLSTVYLSKQSVSISIFKFGN